MNRTSRSLLSSRHRARRIRARAGFTLVETIVAVVMLAIGVLALASSSSTLTRQLSGSAQRNQAAAMATERLERFRSYANCAGIDTTAQPTVATRGLIDGWASTPSINLRELRYWVRRATPRAGMSDTLLSTHVRIRCNG